MHFIVFPIYIFNIYDYEIYIYSKDLVLQRKRSTARSAATITYN